MLTSDELAVYLQSIALNQVAGIQGIRKLLVELAPDLVEEVDDDKWFRGLLTYKTPDGIFAYALGPRAGGYITFHMMPFYGSEELQRRHAAVLKRFQSGKSCIRFRSLDELPIDALRDIVGATARYAEVAKETMASRKG